jgi:hypothetical protein
MTALITRAKHLSSVFTVPNLSSFRAMCLWERSRLHHAASVGRFSPLLSQYGTCVLGSRGWLLNATAGQYLGPKMPRSSSTAVCWLPCHAPANLGSGDHSHTRDSFGTVCSESRFDRNLGT